METKALGSSTCFYQKFTVKAGDLINVTWQNGTPNYSTIMPESSFDANQFGGPGPKFSDATSSRWQVPSDGVWVAFVIAPDPANGFSANASLQGGAPVQVYSADKISYGDLSAQQAQAMINRVFDLANERRMNPASREGNPLGTSDDPGPASKKLVLDAKLNLAAQSHCMNMALQDFSGHDGKDGSDQASRIGAVGFAATVTGEILAYGQGTPEGAIKAWMESTHGHRGNLLNLQWICTGIGVYYRADDPGQVNYRYYWAMVFANPR